MKIINNENVSVAGQIMAGKTNRKIFIKCFYIDEIEITPYLKSDIIGFKQESVSAKGSGVILGDISTFPLLENIECLENSSYEFYNISSIESKDIYKAYNIFKVRIYFNVIIKNLKK